MLSQHATGLSGLRRQILLSGVRGVVPGGRVIGEQTQYGKVDSEYRSVGRAGNVRVI